MKALQYLNSNINAVAIKRKGVGYNSLEVVDNIASATLIREKILKNEFESVAELIPENCYKIIDEEIINGKLPISIMDFEKEILYSFRKNTIEDISTLSDVTEGLENTLKKCSNEEYTLNEFIDAVKSKRYTKTRIQRLTINSLLDIKKFDVECYKHNLQYIRILGFNKTGEKLLSKAHNNANIPIVTNVPKFMKVANDVQKKMLEKDILASNIYSLGYQVPNYRKVNLDYTMPIVQV